MSQPCIMRQGDEHPLPLMGARNALSADDAPSSFITRGASPSHTPLTGSPIITAAQAAAKRFKITGSGKVMARHAGKQHFNEKMTRDEIRCAARRRGKVRATELTGRWAHAGGSSQGRGREGECTGHLRMS